MTLEQIKQQNIQFSVNNKTSNNAEYIVSFSAVYQRPGQKPTVVEDTICLEIQLQSDAKAKDLIESIKRGILKEKLKDTRIDNLKKLIIFNLYKFKD